MKIIELKQAPVILVELPEVADNLQIFNDIGRPYLSYYTKPVNTHRAYLPDGDYVVLGILSDLTEEQFAECVKHGLGLYANYNETVEFGTAMRFEKASESFYSLLESEKVYTENPYKVYGETNTCSCTHDNGEEKCEIIKYEEAQQRTIDPKHTVVLLRKEETK